MKDIEKTEFEYLFKQIAPEDITDNIYTLMGKDCYAITAGKKGRYNSMIGSGGGFGLFFRKPTTWCLIRGDRYTLELLEKEQSYTLSFFPLEYKEQMMLFAKESGRLSNKMKETKLSATETPFGNISFKEARLIIECRLTALTSMGPECFCDKEAKDYINEAYKEAGVHRKIVYGEICRVWIKK